jgi:hypothetical protein
MTLRIKDSTIAEERQWFLYQCQIFTKCFVDLHRSLSNSDQDKAMKVINLMRKYAELELESRKEDSFELEVNLAKLETFEELKEILT